MNIAALRKCSLLSWWSHLLKFPSSKQYILFSSDLGPVTSDPPRAKWENSPDDERWRKSAAVCILRVWTQLQHKAQPALLQDKHLEVLKLLMTPAESLSSQSQPCFTGALCQSESRPAQTGGPVRVSEKERVEKKRTEQRKEKFWLLE